MCVTGYPFHLSDMCGGTPNCATSVKKLLVIKVKGPNIIRITLLLPVTSELRLHDAEDEAYNRVTSPYFLDYLLLWQVDFYAAYVT
jgi:hypothetical protein